MELQSRDLGKDEAKEIPAIGYHRKGTWRATAWYRTEAAGKRKWDSEGRIGQIVSRRFRNEGDFETTKLILGRRRVWRARGKK